MPSLHFAVAPAGALAAADLPGALVSTAVLAGGTGVCSSGGVRGAAVVRAVLSASQVATPPWLAQAPLRLLALL